MSMATIIMTVLICVGCGLVIAALAVALYHGLRLRKSALEAGVSSRAELQEVIGRAQRLGPRLEAMEAKQKVVAERLSRLSTTTRKPE
jgi:hypothetical protein